MEDREEREEREEKEGIKTWFIRIIESSMVFNLS